MVRKSQVEATKKKIVSVFLGAALLFLAACEREKEYCEYHELTGEKLVCVWMTESEYERARAKRDIETIRKAMSYYAMEIGQIPTQEQGITALTEPPKDIDATRYPTHGYLERIVDDPWGSPYEYVVPALRSKDEFDVYSSGPDGAPNTDDDIGNWE